MNMNNDTLPLRQISAMVSTIAFIADLITVALFIRDLLISGGPPPFGTVVAQVALIAAIFTFAILLFIYARQEYTSLDSIVGVFGWLYIVLAAALFAVISHRFIVEANYDFGEFIGYIILIALIAGLGYGITLMVERRTSYYSIPFMLVALEQIVLWLLLIVSRQGITFDWTFIGNLLFFGYAGLLILFFIIPPDKIWS